MLENTRLFIKVVQQGSFSKAAALLKMPKSTVSRAVRQLEDDTGTKLLFRTTRSLSLTASGRAFYDACLGPLQSLEDAERSLRGQDSMIAGKIKLTAPEDLGAHVISPTLAHLAIEHPQLSFEIHYSNDVIDLVRDGYDIAVRIGKLNPSSFKAKRVGVISLVMVASPEYLKQASAPKHPDDLIEHACLTLNLATVVPRWILTDGKSSATASIRPRMICNQMTSLVRLALSGAGIALVPKYLVKNALEQKELVHILPTWYQNQYPVSLVLPLASHNAARLKLCAAVLEREIALSLS